MRTASIRELKARLSAYLREVQAGETVLVTDRGRAVAKLVGPGEQVEASSPLARLAALGARLPLRTRRPSDYARPGAGAGLSTAAIDALLDEVRGDR